MELPPDAPTVRLCYLAKWPDFSGYGFNLHTDKVKNIQTLGDIDKGSPAEAAGLMKGDRIVEVNGQNVFNENHRQVVERIKAVPNETSLLVVDSVSDAWYRDRNIVIHGALPSVQKLTSDREHNLHHHSNKMTNGGGNGNGAPVAEPAPRLCHLRKWADFDGYGFNLHADKAKGTQFVGIVDPLSPAEAAGMLQSDKIIEVNGENVEHLSHKDIVERIKAVPNETTLLLVDEATNKYYKDKGIQISSSLKNVIRMETPSANPHNNRANKTMPPLPKTPPPQNNNNMENNTNDGSSSDEFVPRLCLLRKWADYEGYGFNLHADKANNLHFIGEVDEGSPAKLGGLRPGDRLVEVNGTNIDNIAHREIIERIKSNPQQTELLVVCKETDRLYREKGQVPRGDMPQVRHHDTPMRSSDTTAAEENQMAENDASSKASNSPKMLPSTPSSNRSEELPPATPSTTMDEYEVNGVNSPSPANNMEPPSYSDMGNGRASADSPTSPPPPQAMDNMKSTPRQQTNTTDHRADMGGEVSPIFNMKASDVREMLKQRKKKDPRVQNMDLMQKFKIMEQL